MSAAVRQGYLRATRDMVRMVGLRKSMAIASYTYAMPLLVSTVNPLSAVTGVLALATFHALHLASDAYLLRQLSKYSFPTKPGDVDYEGVVERTQGAADPEEAAYRDTLFRADYE
jgi:hypothetical protein